MSELEKSATPRPLASRFSGRPVKPFTIGFGESSYDERPFARTVATQCGTDHEEVMFSAREAAGLMHDVGRLLDEPLVDSSFLPLYLLSRSARREVTVVLSGDGGTSSSAAIRRSRPSAASAGCGDSRRGRDRPPPRR